MSDGQIIGIVCGAVFVVIIICIFIVYYTGICKGHGYVERVPTEPAEDVNVVHDEPNNAGNEVIPDGENGCKIVMEPGASLTSSESDNEDMYDSDHKADDTPRTPGETRQSVIDGAR